jgi:hypothetical protein
MQEGREPEAHPLPLHWRIQFSIVSQRAKEKEFSKEKNSAHTHHKELCGALIRPTPRPQKQRAAHIHCAAQSIFFAASTPMTKRSAQSDDAQPAKHYRIPRRSAGSDESTPTKKRKSSKALEMQHPGAPTKAGRGKRLTPQDDSVLEHLDCADARRALDADDVVQATGNLHITKRQAAGIASTAKLAKALRERWPGTLPRVRVELRLEATPDTDEVSFGSVAAGDGDTTNAAEQAVKQAAQHATADATAFAPATAPDAAAAPTTCEDGVLVPGVALPGAEPFVSGQHASEQLQRIPRRRLRPP